MPVPLALVVAAARNGVIGRDNQLIWRLKTDLRRFRTLTLGKPVLMGRKTFDSIGKPLPGRDIIVITRDPAFNVPGVEVVHGIDRGIVAGQARAAATGADAVIVAGGAEVYRATLPLADRIHLTLVDLEPRGDAFFGPVDAALFLQTHREPHAAGPEDEVGFTFIDYERRRKQPS